MSDQPQEDSQLSPSLVTRVDKRTAFEMKFMVNESQARAIEAWAGQHMQIDLHGDPDLRGSYQISSLYTDTISLDVFHRVPKYRRRKYRLRRYGNEPIVYLEQKFRKGNRVMKRRTDVPDSDLSLLANAFSVSDWAGNWFHQHLIRKALIPTCQLTYRRTAYHGSCSEGPLRLTLDRHIFGQLTSHWGVGLSSQVLSLLPDESVILELKFQDALPSIFKKLLAEMQFTPSGFSKYRNCIKAWQENQSFGKLGGEHA
jgi:hypothetical protein